MSEWAPYEPVSKLHIPAAGQFPLTSKYFQPKSTSQNLTHWGLGLVLEVPHEEKSHLLSCFLLLDSSVEVASASSGALPSSFYSGNGMLKETFWKYFHLFAHVSTSLCFQGCVVDKYAALSSMTGWGFLGWVNCQLDERRLSWRTWGWGSSHVQHLGPSAGPVGSPLSRLQNESSVLSIPVGLMLRCLELL